MVVGQFGVWIRVVNFDNAEEIEWVDLMKYVERIRKCVKGIAEMGESGIERKQLDQ